jgi:hypothetical protein
MAVGQTISVQQADKAGVTRGLEQVSDMPALVHGAAVAEGVQTHFVAVADQHKLAAGQVFGVFSGLLHRAFVAAQHEGFQVAGSQAS